MTRPSRRPTRALAVVLLFAALVPAAVVGAASAGTGGEPGGSQPLPVPEQPPGEVRQTADDVLARDEYRHDPSLVERALGWLSDRLDELFSLVGGGAGGQSVLGWVFVALLLGVVTFLVVLLLRSVRRGGSSSTDQQGVEVTTTGGRVDWTKRAEQAEADGRWRLGLRCRYRALTERLDEVGVLDGIPGRTSGEQRVEVAERAPEAAASFAGAAELFDRAWYGNRPTGPDESARFQALASDVLARARRPGRRPVDELDELVAPR